MPYNFQAKQFLSFAEFSGRERTFFGLEKMLKSAEILVVDPKELFSILMVKKPKLFQACSLCLGWSFSKIS